MDTTASAPPLEAAPAAAPRRIYRHRLPVRVMHWINVVCLTILLMSGLNIFNAHPALYWGQDSTFDRPWLSIGAREHAGRAGRQDAHRRPRLRRPPACSACPRSTARPAARAFPSWATIPGPQWLAMARHWHFFFAWLFVINGVAYVLYTIFSRHLTQRPRADARRAAEHRPLDRRPPQVPASDRRGGDALQRAAEPHLPDRHLRPAAAGGDRRAGDVAAARRRLHRLGRSARRPAVGAHAALPRRVRPAAASSSSTSSRWSIAGVWNEMRSMITGWYTLPAERRARKEERGHDEQDLHPDARPGAIAATCCAAPSPPPARRCSAGCDRLSNNESFVDDAEERGAPEPRRAAGSSRRGRRWRRSSARPTSRRSFAATARSTRGMPTTSRCARPASRPTGSASAGWSRSPLEFSSTQLRAMPSRTQITRHDCVEGWSCIGKWKGVPLGALLDQVRPKPRGAVRRLPLLRLDGRAARSTAATRATTRASTSTTRTTRRRSSPTT